MSFIPENVKRLKNSSGREVVPVLAEYNVNGQIRPLRVRINGRIISIDHYVRERRIQSTIEIFRCTVSDNGISREISLAFHENEMCWSIKY